VAWIESHQTLAKHPKTKRFARAAGISIPEAIGHLHLLWWWALDYAQDGNLSKYTEEDIADASIWNGVPNVFVDSLIKAGFIDNDDGQMCLHDWYDYAEKLIERHERVREQTRDRVKKYRNKNKVRTEKDCNAGVTRYSNAGVTAVTRLPDLTEPDLTEPDLTEPDLTEPDLKGQGQKPHPYPPHDGGESDKGPDSPNAKATNDASKTSLDTTNDASASLDKRRGEQKPKKPPKTQYAEFVSMTDDEHSSLVAKLGVKGAARCVEILDNSKGANGKKYVSDYRAILNWVVKRYEDERAEGRKKSGNPWMDMLRGDYHDSG
jgi:hypothetical protein